MNSKTMHWIIYDLLVQTGHIKSIGYGLGDQDGCLVERNLNVYNSHTNKTPAKTPKRSRNV